jgi:hypothetical protein
VTVTGSIPLNHSGTEKLLIDAGGEKRKFNPTIELGHSRVHPPVSFNYIAKLVLFKVATGPTLKKKNKNILSCLRTVAEDDVAAIFCKAIHNRPVRWQGESSSVIY